MPNPDEVIEAVQTFLNVPWTGNIAGVYERYEPILKTPEALRLAQHVVTTQVVANPAKPWYTKDIATLKVKFLVEAARFGFDYAWPRFHAEFVQIKKKVEQEMGL